MGGGVDSFGIDYCGTVDAPADQRRFDPLGRRGKKPPSAAEINRINERFYKQKEWFVQHSQVTQWVKKAMHRYFKKREEVARDAVNHPRHYNTGKIEVCEFVEDQRLGFHLGNVVKYVCRAGRKDKATRIQDLEKAVWYLQRKIELLKAKRDGRPVRRPNDMNRPRPMRLSDIVTVTVGSDGSAGRK